MKKRFISLARVVPEGFVDSRPSKGDLLHGVVALLVESDEQPCSLLPDFEDRVRGLLIRVGDESGSVRLGPGLWRLTVPSEVLPHLKEMAACALDAILSGVEAMDSQRRLEIELERSRRSLHQAREGFGASSLRLGKMIEDLRSEVAHRARAEAALRSSEKRQRDILNNTSSVIYLKDPEGRFLFVNRMFANLVHIPAEELRGLTDADIFGAEAAEAFSRNDRLVLREGRLMEFEEVARHDDGDHTYISVKFPLLDEAGVPYAVCGVSTDITERRRAEAERARLEAENHQVRKVESVGRLAGGVAHDLNNLLSPIIGYTEMLIDDLRPGDRGGSELQEVLDAGIKARDLVRQLLAFSRKQILQYRPIDLNQVVHGMQRLLRRAIPEDIEIVLRPTPDLATVMADQGQLEQVIMNLAINAAEAMPRGGRLTLQTSNRSIRAADPPASSGMPASGLYAVLTVSDTGTGIEPEVMEHLFEPFYSTKGDKGTGLGLATVYGIVKQHKGWILADSAPGAGATFEVMLPAATAHTGAEADVAETPVQPRGGTETILLVEDHDQVLRLARRILDRHGYRVLEAADPARALEILDSTGDPVDLLLSDVVMPGMNGPELFEQAAARQPGLKVLFMSGYPGDVVTNRGVLEESHELVSKPFSGDYLATRVRQALDRPR